jgi:hypothetical protein
MADSLRDLVLADLSESELRKLVAAGETAVVERKRKPPREGLGPTIASFANSGGGWVLVGVDNDGTVTGFVPPGRDEPQDWLRNKLRAEVDPLPPFVCRTMALDDQEVVVVQVEASGQTPHLCRATGAVYVREPGGKKPISTQAALLALSTRPEAAQHAAYTRMTSLPLVVGASAQHAPGRQVNGQTRIADWMIVASPLAVPQSFRTRALSRPVAHGAQVRVLDLVAELGPPLHASAQIRPYGSGFGVDGRNAENGQEAHMLVDAGGVVVGRIRVPLTRGVCHVGTVADDILSPLLRLALDPLVAAGAYGGTHLHLHIRITPTAPDAAPVLTLSTAHVSGELHAPPGAEAFFGGDIDLPAEPQAVAAVAELWMREIARTAGIDWWEE